MSKINQIENKINHYIAYQPGPFTKEERATTTLVFGGLTFKHERLLQAILENSGYKTELLPEICRQDLDFGKEYVDVGACCPTTFTTGNLARFLKEKVKKEGKEAVIKNYVFVTVGACGPCRLGQYHISYESALDILGLRDFRIFLLAQDKVYQKENQESLEFSENSILGFMHAVMLADVLQDLEYKIRPYEVVQGKTNQVLIESIEYLYQFLKEKPVKKFRLNSAIWNLFTNYYIQGLRQIRKKWEEIEVDRLQIKPKVKITGEFWVQTHEGQGNYNIKSWLEKEGAEVIPPPVTIWFDYLASRWAKNIEFKKGVVKIAFLKEKLFQAISLFLNWRYNQFRKVFNNIPDHLPPQKELAKLATSFFHGDLGGGEGYMLIGKALYSFFHKKAHMICELSPYACMPNTMSQGAMAGVLGKYPDLLYAPIEIKGDSEVHALSRCQMVFHSAKEQAKKEFEEALGKSRLTLEKIRDFEEKNPYLKKALYPVTGQGYISTAANYIIHLSQLMKNNLKL